MTDRLELVRSWLKRQGYSLEYFGARSLRLQAFHVRRSYPWLDPQTRNAWREIDLVAHRASFPMGRLGEVTAVVVVEAKHSDLPWVILTDEPVEGAGLIHHAPHDVPWDDFELLPQAFDLSKVIGFTMTTAKKAPRQSVKKPAGGTPPGESEQGGAEATDSEPKDSAFEALMQAVKAAIYVDGNDSNYLSFSRVVFPVVLTDAQLFEVSYGSDGAERVVEVQTSTLGMWSPLRPHPVVVTVVRRDEFSSYLRDVIDRLDSFRALVLKGAPNGESIARG